MSTHRDGRGGWLARDRDDELVDRILNRTTFGQLLLAAETTDLRQLRTLAAACRATADRLERYAAGHEHQAPAIARMFLREVASRADHNALREQRMGRQLELRPMPVLPLR